MMQSAAKSELNFRGLEIAEVNSEQTRQPSECRMASKIGDLVPHPLPARSSYRLDRNLPRSARRSAPLRVTSLGIGTMGLAVLFFEFGPTGVEVIQRVLSRVQRGLRAY